MDLSKKTTAIRSNVQLQSQKQNKDFGGQYSLPIKYTQAATDEEEPIDKNQNHHNLQSQNQYRRQDESKIEFQQTNYRNYDLNFQQSDELYTNDQQSFYKKQLQSGLPQTLQSPQMLDIQRPVQTGYITSDQEDYDKYLSAQHSSKSQQNMPKNTDTNKFKLIQIKQQYELNQQKFENLAKNQQSSIRTQRSTTPRGQNFYQAQQLGPVSSRNDKMRSSLESRSYISLGSDGIKQTNEKHRQIVGRIQGREEIIRALRLNQAIKQAIRQKIRKSTLKAISIIINALRKFKTFKKAQQLRRQGIFDATIYLETNKNEKINSNTKVECFGEFSRDKKWQVRVPCIYQESTQCFKCNIQIKVGDHFKFVIENGQRYVVSKRYLIQADSSGNSNNVFQTKQICWNNNERKKKKSYGSEHNYNVQAFKKNSWAQKSEYLVTQQKKQNNNDGITLIHKQNNFTMNVGNDIFDFQKTQQIEYHNIDTQKMQNEDIQDDLKISKTNLGNLEKEQTQQQSYNYASININEGLNSNSTSNKSITLSSLNPNQFNQQQQQKSGMFWEPNVEQVKYNRDFRELFEEFFGGDLSTQAYSHKTIQSGLHVFQYNEEEEYVENLNISGIFPIMTEKTLKSKQKAKSNQNLDSPIYLIPTNFISDCSVEKEIKTIQNYENIFDLTNLYQEGQKVDLNYKDLTMEQMHKRYTSPKKIDINKRPIVVVKQQQRIVNQKNIKSQQASPVRSVARGASKNSGNTPEIIQKNQQNSIKVHELIQRNLQQNSLLKEKKKKNTSPKSDGEGPLMNVVNIKNRNVGEIKTPIPQIDESEETQVKLNNSQLQSNSNQNLKQYKIEETDSLQKSQGLTPSKGSLKVVKELSKSPRESKKSPGETKIPPIESRKSQKSDKKSKKSLKESGNSIVPIAEVNLDLQESEDATSNAVINEQPQKQNPDQIQTCYVNQEEQIQKNEIISKQQNEIDIIKELKTEPEFQPNILQQQQISVPESQDQIKTCEPDAITTCPNIYIESVDQIIAVVKQESDEPCPFIVKVDENDIQESEAIVLEGHNIVKRTKATDTQNLSEISFFYENDEEEDSKGSEDEDEDEKADFILIQGAHCQGKAPHQCEDAYFVSDRAFGVSDGVSGWNDYGFSSDQFSLQLMSFSKQILEKCLRRGFKTRNSLKSQRKSSCKNSKMRKNQSFLSMDNLDIQEQSEEDEETNSKDDQGRLSLNSSRSSQSDTPEEVGSQGNQIDSDVLKKSMNKLGHKTERHDKELSPLRKSDNLDAHSQSNASQNIHISAQLEREISRRTNQVKINQDYINNWTWDLRKSMNQEIFQKGTAQNGDEVTFKNTPSKEMKINSQMYNTVLYPTYILQKAFLKVNAVGSATALIAILNKDELSIANIGDSGFLVIRFKNGEPYCPHKSKEQQHAFNIPFQLSQLPTQADLEILRKQGKLSEMAKLKNVLKKKNNVCQDSPESADDYTVELRDGDIVVTATDGVFDNLFQHEILTIVGEYRKEQGQKLTKDSQAQELAQILVNASISKFKNPKGKKTPYQRKYKKTYNATWEGGKEDDITVLVSIARKIRVIQHQKQNNDLVDDNCQGKIFTDKDLKDIIDQ